MRGFQFSTCLLLKKNESSLELQTSKLAPYPYPIRNGCTLLIFRAVSGADGQKKAHGCWQT